MNLPEGHSLQNAKYHLTKAIGQGGFGITYLGVWNTEVKGELGTVKTEVPVCIKEYFFKDYCYRDKTTAQVLVHSETGRQLFDKFKEKLIKEAKILSDVHHPFIVNVLEVFEENNTAYIAMEHILGCSLKYMLDVEGILPENKVLRYISQIGQALDFVHQKNVLHLDIKPSNILIDKKNNARLIDFGVSKRYDIEQQETSTTMLTLSKGFAPIEQYDDEGTQSFSPCPDIYSLGATMYNLLTGVIPTESILRVAKPLVKPSEFNSEVTQQTENAILKAMQVNPIHRYQSVKAMINELDIPSYFEETTHSLFENTDYQSKNKEDEETTLLSDSNISQPVDDDQTILRQPEELNKPVRKKKRKRRILIPLLIFVFAFLWWGVAYFFDLNGLGGAVQNSGNPASGIDGLMLPVLDEKTEEEESTATIINTTESRLVESTISDVIAQNNPTAQTVLPEVNPNTPTPEMIDEEYNSLLASGREKNEQKNYTEARADVEKANELKPNMEALQLLMEINTAEEADMIIARKALYEEIMPFGNLMIVRKKATGRWGAIDNTGHERIDCIYLRASTSGNDKAFERADDNLYDIYDVTGKRVAEKRPDY